MKTINVDNAQMARQRWLQGNALSTTLDVGCNTGFLFREWKNDTVFCDQYSPIQNAIIEVYRKFGKTPVDAVGAVLGMENPDLGLIPKDELDIIIHQVIPKFRRGTAEDLPFNDDTFYTVVLGDVLEHVDDPIQCLREAKRVSTGQVLVSVPNEKEWISTNFPNWVQDKTEFSDHVRQYGGGLIDEHMGLAGLTPYEEMQITGGGWSFFLVKYTHPVEGEKTEGGR